MKKTKAHPDAVKFTVDVRKYLVHVFQFAKEYLLDAPASAASIHHLLHKFRALLWQFHPKVLVENRPYIEAEIYAEFTRSCSNDDSIKRSVNQCWVDFVIESIEEHGQLANNEHMKILPDVRLEADIRSYVKLRATIAEGQKSRGFCAKVVEFSCDMDLRRPEILIGFSKTDVDAKLKILPMSDNIHEMWQGDASRRILTPLPYARKIALSVLSHFRSEEGDLGFRKLCSVQGVMDRAFGDSIMLLGPAGYMANSWLRIVLYVVRTIHEIFLEINGEHSRPYASSMAVALLGVMNEYYQLDENVLLICDYLPGATEISNRGEVCWNVLSTILGWSEDLTPLWFNKIPSDFQLNEATARHYLKFFKSAHQLGVRAVLKCKVDLVVQIENATNDLKTGLTNDLASEFMRPPHRQNLSEFMDKYYKADSWFALKDVWLDLAIYSSYMPVHRDLYFVELEQRYTGFLSALKSYTQSGIFVPLPEMSIDDLKTSPVFKDFNPKEACNILGDYSGERRAMWPGDVSHSLGQVKPSAIWLVHEVLSYLKDGKNGVIDITELLVFIQEREKCLVDSVYIYSPNDLQGAYAMIVCLGRCLIEILIALECHEISAVRLGHVLIAALCSFRQIEIPAGAQVSMNQFRLPIHKDCDFELGVNIISMHLNWKGKKPNTAVFGGWKIQMTGKWEQYRDFVFDRVRFRVNKVISVDYRHTACKSLLNPPPEKLSVIRTRFAQEIVKVETALEATEAQIKSVKSLINMIEERISEQIKHMNTVQLLIETRVAVSQIDAPKRAPSLDDEGERPFNNQMVPPVMSLKQQVLESIAEFALRIGSECGYYGNRLCVALFIGGLKDKQIRRRLLDRDPDACDKFTLKEAAVAANILSCCEEDRRSFDQLFDNISFHYLNNLP